MIVDEDYYVNHAGVKGMKWGVRRQRRLEELQRVSRGEGSLRENVKAALTTSGTDIARARGNVRKAVGLKAQRIEERKKRTLAGKATALDILKHIGETSVLDLGRLDR